MEVETTRFPELFCSPRPVELAKSNARQPGRRWLPGDFWASVHTRTCRLTQSRAKLPLSDAALVVFDTAAGDRVATLGAGWTSHASAGLWPRILIDTLAETWIPLISLGACINRVALVGIALAVANALLIAKKQEGWARLTDKRAWATVVNHTVTVFINTVTTYLKGLAGGLRCYPVEEHL